MVTISFIIDKKRTLSLAAIFSYLKKCTLLLIKQHQSYNLSFPKVVGTTFYTGIKSYHWVKKNQKCAVQVKHVTGPPSEVTTGVPQEMICFTQPHMYMYSLFCVAQTPPPLYPPLQEISHDRGLACASLSFSSQMHHDISRSILHLKKTNKNCVWNIIVQNSQHTQLFQFNECCITRLIPWTRATTILNTTA